MNSFVSTMNLVCIMKFKLGILLALCVVAITHAMPGNKHGQDIKGSFGAKSISAVELGRIVSQVADEPINLNELPRILNLTNSTGRIVSFQGGHGIHRVVFHWGWNGSPKKHEKLQAYLKNQKLTSKQIGMINTYISTKWAKRKWDAGSKFTRLYGAFRARKLAAIAYDIHILGDLGGSGDGYMISRMKLMDDLCRHVGKLKGSEKLVADLRHSYPKTALRTLKAQLPDIINNNFPAK